MRSLLDPLTHFASSASGRGVEDVGRRIRHWRAVAGLTQEDLAKACEVTVGAVWQWENDYSPPTLKNLGKIAKACGVALRTFFSDLPAKATG